MTFLSRLLLPSTLFAYAIAAALQANAREWVDNSGKFRVEAEFVLLKDGKVSLRKADESIIEVPLQRLSVEDREWVKSTVLKQQLAEEVRKAVDVINQADTSAKRDLIRGREVTRIEKEFNGKECSLDFRITDVSRASSGAFFLQLTPLDFNEHRGRYPIDPGITLKLTEDEVLKIKPGDPLHAEGKLVVNYQGRDQPMADVFQFSMGDELAIILVGLVDVEYFFEPK